MKLTGSEYQQLQRALLNAYTNRSELEQMVLFKLGESLATIVGNSNLSTTIFELIQWAVAHGRLGDLITGAQDFNRNNPELNAFIEHVWQAKIAESSPPVDPNASASVERERLQNLLAAQQSNLYKLELQKAQYGGIDVPLRILNQLEETASEIAKLEAQIKLLPPAATIPTPPASRAQTTVRRHDTYTPYETAIEDLLRRLGPQHARYTEALTYQQRLNENIDTSRRYGDTEATRSARAQIIAQLNGLALDEFGTAFTQLV